MFIAHKLKKENISQYLLYMWQIEDLIRAFQLNIDALNERIIGPYPVKDDERKSLYGWYESLIEMMRLENVQNAGHLQLNKNIMLELNELHKMLDIMLNFIIYYLLSANSGIKINQIYLILNCVLIFNMA